MNEEKRRKTKIDHVRHSIKIISFFGQSLFFSSSFSLLQNEMVISCPIKYRLAFYGRYKQFNKRHKFKTLDKYHKDFFDYGTPKKSNNTKKFHTYHMHGISECVSFFFLFEEQFIPINIYEIRYDVWILRFAYAKFGQAVMIITFCEVPVLALFACSSNNSHEVFFYNRIF